MDEKPLALTAIADWSNETSRAVCNTYLQNFIRKLAEHWM